MITFDLSSSYDTELLFNALLRSVFEYQPVYSTQAISRSRPGNLVQILKAYCSKKFEDTERKKTVFNTVLSLTFSLYGSFAEWVLRADRAL
jgi:uncharacterized protein VirK/YbjX